VSIAELPNSRPRDPNINSVGAEFERTPPQDLIAEQSVLGGMLLSRMQSQMLLKLFVIAISIAQHMN